MHKYLRTVKKTLSTQLNLSINVTRRYKKEYHASKQQFEVRSLIESVGGVLERFLPWGLHRF